METFEFVVFETIDTAKYQGRIPKIEIGQALHESIVDGVALKAVLKGSAQSGLGVTPQFEGVSTTPLKAVVCMIDIGLFVIKVWVLSGHKESIDLI